MCIERPETVRIVPAMEKWIELVKIRMRALNLTQEQLAERLGVTQGAVGHWLRGKRRISLEKMNKVLVALELEMEMGATALAEEPASYELPTAYRYPLSDWQRLGAIEEGDEATDSGELTEYRALGKAYWLRVEGDAMTAPSGMSIAAGMLILVDSGVEVQVGKLVIAHLPGSPQGIFRQLVQEGGQRFLKPLNPTYPMMLCDDDCELVGVVVRANLKL
ncbi:helix-turn-helix domain-containing protein [Pseudomonas sp. 20P_3.2_Bac4]|nr:MULTISPECIES: S24 family peptidase [unclassified Pseudomonas]MCU1734632.1 helix-turn-helix domain-containing protein [Pseudomonas sp. 20P_3.2_Bac4]MCU1743043.1 helix-turn-helix domain-containing protein [Pseudomonas sp. 20P_3.2_Bac5]